jgi:hypothetical protein
MMLPWRRREVDQTPLHREIDNHRSNEVNTKCKSCDVNAQIKENTLQECDVHGFTGGVARSGLL